MFANFWLAELGISGPVECHLSIAPNRSFWPVFFLFVHIVTRKLAEHILSPTNVNVFLFFIVLWSVCHSLHHDWWCCGCYFPRFSILIRLKALIRYVSMRFSIAFGILLHCDIFEGLIYSTFQENCHNIQTIYFRFGLCQFRTDVNTNTPFFIGALWQKGASSKNYYWL